MIAPSHIDYCPAPFRPLPSPHTSQLTYRLAAAHRTTRRRGRHRVDQRARAQHRRAEGDDLQSAAVLRGEARRTVMPPPQGLTQSRVASLHRYIVTSHRHLGAVDDSLAQRLGERLRVSCEDLGLVVRT